MDIVLEAVDSYGMDAVFAFLFPTTKTSGFAPNSTYSSIAEAPTATPYINNGWEYTPASQYLSFPPGPQAYMSEIARDDWRRQLTSLFLITWLFGVAVYYLIATASYVFVFDKSTFNHPRYLKNQIRLEMKQANTAFPIMAVLTAPLFLIEVRGYSKIYDTVDDAPASWYNVAQFPLFLMFTDLCIYWIHRGLHHPNVYKHIHKPHHKWIMPTPFASHAFHPLDGYAQGLPYHLFPFIFPLQKFAYVLLFAFVNIWTVLIHDGEYYAENPIINGAACHTMHHLYFNFNYGQYTTLWDRLGGSYRKPNDELFRKELKMCETTWKKQANDADKMVNEVEGSDDRSYVPETKKVR
ncbi:hypothetical protein P280DRAFT_482700 [Massarina eburnea CBS 473.64]|uniref:Fatty acid hydroxylase domain-containing protein n=1 Tax=Massarina eburnea CBS 473.64 TaxID=1395130 RepID=A0A6A6RT07_9PLEO|nr:hypothetical protein P280DRAFT_482700 [Massarina eburnea CBS 473.64]